VVVDLFSSRSDFDTRDLLRRHLSDTVFGLSNVADLPLPASPAGNQPASVTRPFPDAPITYISGTNTAGICAWNAAEDERRWRESLATASDISPREVKWVQLAGGNHFAFWDMPEVFLKAVSAGLEAKSGERVVL